MELPWADDLVLVCRNRGSADRKIAEMEEGHAIEGEESKHWEKEGPEVSGEQG